MIYQEITCYNFYQDEYDVLGIFEGSSTAIKIIKPRKENNYGNKNR